MVDFQGKFIRPGDGVVLQHKATKAKVTITLKEYQGTWGLKDTNTESWNLDHWDVVGLIPFVSPSPAGWYLLTEQMHEDFPIWIDSDGTWRSYEGGNDIDRTRYPEDVQLVRLVKESEHFTAISSEGDKIYHLFDTPEGLTCTCLGYFYRKDCKHVKDLAFVVVPQ